MRIVFTKHAREQMGLRGIETVRYHHRTSRIGEGRYVVRRKLNGISLEAVYEKKTHINVITVYAV